MLQARRLRPRRQRPRRTRPGHQGGRWAPLGSWRPTPRHRRRCRRGPAGALPRAAPQAAPLPGLQGLRQSRRRAGAGRAPRPGGARRRGARPAPAAPRRPSPGRARRPVGAGPRSLRCQAPGRHSCGPAAEARTCCTSCWRASSAAPLAALSLSLSASLWAVRRQEQASASGRAGARRERLMGGRGRRTDRPVQQVLQLLLPCAAATSALLWTAAQSLGLRSGS